MYSGCAILNAPLSKHSALCSVWLGEEGVEIKRQITGMMRFLSDKPGRVHQRVGAEGENLKKEPQDEHLSWAHHPTALPLVSEDHQDNILGSTGDPGPSLSTTSTNKGQGYGQYSTRSKTLRVQNSSKDVVKMNEYNGKACLKEAEVESNEVVLLKYCT